MVDNHSSRIAKNTIYMFIRMLLVAVISFYTSRIVLEVLGITDYGIYNIVGSVVVFLSFFKNALTNATYRYIAYELGTGNRDKLKKIFSMSLNVHLLLSIIIFFILEIIGVWFLNNELNIPLNRLTVANWVFQFSLITLCIEIIKTPYNSIIVANERMSFFSYTGIIEVLLKLGVVFLLQIIDFDKLIVYSTLLIIVSLLMFLWYKLYCYNHFSETHYEYCWDKSMLHKLATYSGWSIVVNIADVSVSQCINVFLNLFFGVAANAAMGIANQINNLLNQFLNSFSTAYNPQIIKSYASGDKNYFMKLLYSTSKLSFFLLFAVAFPVILNIDLILKLWLVNPPQEAGVFLICIACYSLFDSFSVPLWNAVHATGNLKVHQILMFTIKVLNIPLGYLLLKKGFPAYSILILYAILNGVCSIVRIVYLRWLINLNIIDYCKNVLLKLILVVSVSICVPIQLVRLELASFPRVIITTIVFLTIYLVIIYLLGLNKQEKNLVNNYIKPKFRRVNL